MFVDRARIQCKAGRGGNGCCSFRREKYVPRGGPDGGDGGKGGDIVFVADPQLTTLLDLQYHSTWKGMHGEHGRGKSQHGKQGETTIIRVPLGSVIRDKDTGEIRAELLVPEQRFVAAEGGRGGKGNARFLSNSNRAPRFAELGEPGEEAHFAIELKLIAEVGLVGLPNAGKSTFLAQVSAATPKIGDYPFTTLSPNLGVARLSDFRTMTIADIPGIIEGAAEGKGLGHDFLRHIERTQVLVFLIDSGDPDPAESYATLERELEQHSPEFEGRPRVIALNKIDISENRARLDAISAQFDCDTMGLSAATGEGTKPLLEHVWSLLEQEKNRLAPSEQDVIEAEYSYEAPFTIEPTRSGFRVNGRKVLRAVQMTDFSNDQAVVHLHHKLQKMGLFKALKRMGASEGQPVFIGDYELEYQPD